MEQLRGPSQALPTSDHPLDFLGRERSNRFEERCALFSSNYRQHAAIDLNGRSSPGRTDTRRMWRFS